MKTPIHKLKKNILKKNGREELSSRENNNAQINAVKMKSYWNGRQKYEEKERDVKTWTKNREAKIRSMERNGKS